MERTTGMGREISDDGVTWLLVEPSQAWLDATAMPIPEPDPAEPVDPVAMLVSALRDPLANLTPSSESTTVRTAILNQRAALDELLAALETP